MSVRFSTGRVFQGDEYLGTVRNMEASVLIEPVEIPVEAIRTAWEGSLVREGRLSITGVKLWEFPLGFVPPKPVWE